MSGFRFRLDKVKRLRDATAKEALWALARAMAEVRELEIRVETVRRQRARVLDDLEKSLRTNGIDLSVVDLHHREVGRLDDVETAALDALRASEERLEEARTEARSRQIDVKALASLEERARGAHDREALQRETREMDEVAASRYRRDTE